MLLIMLCFFSLLANWLLYNAWQQSLSISNLASPSLIESEKSVAVQSLKSNSVASQSEIKRVVADWSEAIQQNSNQAGYANLSWLNQAQQWLAQGQIQAYLSLKHELKSKLPESLDVNLLEYYWQLSQYNLAAAAETIYPLLDQISPEQWQQAELQKLVRLLKILMPDVLKQQSCRSMIDTLEMLVWYDNNQPDYLLALSQCYIQLEEYTLAEQQLIYLLANPDYQEQANTLLAQMHHTPAEQVALDKLGEHFIVRAALSSVASVQLMIDTGASLTSISRTKLNESGVHYTSLGYQTLATAGGLTQAEIIEIESFSVGSKQLKNFKLAVLDIASFSGSDGLLGMNFLAKFPFTIDQQNQTLIFSQN